MRRGRRGIATIGILLIVGGIGAGLGALIHWRPNITCKIIRTACAAGTLAAAGDLISQTPNVPPKVTTAYNGVVTACPGLVTACDNGLTSFGDVLTFARDVAVFAFWADAQPRDRALGGPDWGRLEKDAEKLERKATRELSK